MRPVLIDSNILIDIFSDSEEWGQWSRDQLSMFAGRGRLFINPVIYAEVSIAFTRIEELEDNLALLPIGFREIPKEALFLAGKAFLSYRRKGGLKNAPLPDFYIGAHAAVEGYEVITRDPKRMAHYFPTLTVHSPETLGSAG